MPKMKMQLSFKQILEYIVLGIDNESYQAARNLATDTIKHLEEAELLPDAEE